MATKEQETSLLDGMKSLATSLKHFEVLPSEETLPEEEWFVIRAQLPSTIDNSTQALKSLQESVQLLRKAGEKSFVCWPHNFNESEPENSYTMHDLMNTLY